MPSNTPLIVKLKRKEEFNNGFYDNLRSLVNDKTLMLVVASRKELSVYGSEHRFVSQFFNQGHVLNLDELSINADSVRRNVGTQEY